MVGHEVQPIGIILTKDSFFYDFIVFGTGDEVGCLDAWGFGYG